MLPLAIFSSRQFSGANAATLANYLAIGAVFFFLSLQLQNVLGYSALAAGAATIPATVIMLLFSPQAGKLGERIGPRIPMAVGPLVLAAGTIMLSSVDVGDSYLESVLPGVVVFGIGMTIFVAPLTAAVLAALPDERAGIASAVNNAAARFAQLLASSMLPAAAGLSASTAVGPGEFADGYSTAMLIAAAIAALGGADLLGHDPQHRGPPISSPPELESGLHRLLAGGSWRLCGIRRRRMSLDVPGPDGRCVARRKGRFAHLVDARPGGRLLGLGMIAPGLGRARLGGWFRRGHMPNPRRQSRSARRRGCPIRSRTRRSCAPRALRAAR